MDQKKYFIILSLILACTTITYSLNAALRVHGKIPEDYQLLQKLASTRASELDGYHEHWISLLQEYIHRNNELSNEYQMLSHCFSKSDIDEIVKPILNAQLSTQHIDLESFFPTTIHIITDSKKSDLNYFTQDFIAQHLYKTAHTILSHVNNETLLVMGQTPAYLGHMVKKINHRRGGNTAVIAIPYSGRPDTILPRLNPNRRWNWTMSSYQEILTRNRELFFRSVLIDSGFIPENYTRDSKIYILDNSRGPSIASFLTIICRWFQELGLQFPDFYFINMDNDAQPLDFKMSDTLSFEIDTIYLNMNQTLLNEHFDQLFDNLRVQPPFYAYAWRPESKKFMAQYPQPEAQELLNFYAAYAEKREPLH